jgi:hypothetical protein
MTESDYFRRLEMRVSRELAGMRAPEIQQWWCDGFIPDGFVVVGRRCRVRGNVWMASGPRQELWDFVVHLGPERPRDQVEWVTLLPADDVTGWLSLDFATRFMKVDPTAARPDAEPSVG